MTTNCYNHPYSAWDSTTCWYYNPLAEWCRRTKTEGGDLRKVMYQRVDLGLAAVGTPPRSNWTCHLFGSDGTGLSWTPEKDKEPNFFWCWMQYICFGNKWVKK